MNKKTLVIGASLKSIRYSNIAINDLIYSDIEVVAIGLKHGAVSGVTIIKNTHKENLNDLELSNIHTVTLYLNPVRQKDYFDFVIKLNPKRVIFNPGTENPYFYELLSKNNIDYEESCTLVLLRTEQY